MAPVTHPDDPPTGELSPPAQRPNRTAPKRVALAGLWTFLASAALILSPLALGRSDLNRYLVAFGFVGLCVGLSIMLHGLFDGLRRGGKGK
jgi:hypothetical protein